MDDERTRELRMIRRLLQAFMLMISIAAIGFVVFVGVTGYAMWQAKQDAEHRRTHFPDGFPRNWTPPPRLEH